MKSIGFGAYDNFASVKLPATIPHYPILRKITNNPAFGDLSAFEKLTGWDKFKNIIGLVVILGMVIGAKIYLKRFSLLKKINEEDMPLTGRLLYKSDKYVIPWGLAVLAPYVISLAVGRHIPLIGYSSVAASFYVFYKMWPEFYEMLTEDTPTPSAKNFTFTNR